MTSFRERYPPPWWVERMPARAVRDGRGHVLVRIYAKSEAMKDYINDHERAAHNRWNEYINMLDDRARNIAIERWIDFLVRRIEEESLPN